MPTINQLVRTGRRGEAERALAELEKRREPSIAYEIAVARLAFGQTDAALDSLENAVSDRSERLVDMAIDPRLAYLHGHARFRDVARRVGIPTIA